MMAKYRSSGVAKNRVQLTLPFIPKDQFEDDYTFRKL